MKPILKEIREAYEKHGQSTAFDVANQYNLPYEYCKACETSSPTMNHVCCICGSAIEELVYDSVHQKYFPKSPLK